MGIVVYCQVEGGVGFAHLDWSFLYIFLKNPNWTVLWVIRCTPHFRFERTDNRHEIHIDYTPCTCTGKYHESVAVLPRVP